MQEIKHSSIPAAALRRPRKSGSTRGGWIALGVALAVLFTAAGGYIVYANTLPTSVAFNLRDGEKDVPTDSRLEFRFTRPVALSTLQAALSITPSTDGSLTAVQGETEFAWAPAKALVELTDYTISLDGLTDLGHRPVKSVHWTFTTIIVPRIVSVTTPAGVALVDGNEIDPATPLQLNFNEPMDQASVIVNIGAKVASPKWSADGRSATVPTIGIPSGAFVLSLAPGARDKAGRTIATALSLKSGLYYHDHEKTTALKYPALIQIPNDEAARDQNGLQAAGIVFEYVAEGGITRLTAIYQNAPSLIGPMRSSRFISLKIARHYKGLLFQSGESQATRDRAAGDPVPQFFDTIGYTFRSSARYAPDNLMISGTAVKKAEGLFGLSAFTVTKARPVLPGGQSVSKIAVAEHNSSYSYDATFGTYQKTEDRHLYRDANLRQPLRIEMLVLLHTQVSLLDVGDGHGAHIHDYNIDSGGKIDVYYKGHRFAGTWTSPGSHKPLTFKLSNGQALSLPPGLVWIDVVN